MLVSLHLPRLNWRTHYDFNIRRKYVFNYSSVWWCRLSTCESERSKVRCYIISSICSHTITAKSRPSARKNKLPLSDGHSFSTGYAEQTNMFLNLTMWSEKIWHNISITFRGTTQSGSREYPESMAKLWQFWSGKEGHTEVIYK